MKEKKHPNFQDLYSFEDYKKAYDAHETFDCGLSPVCLLAPDHHTRICTEYLKNRTDKYSFLHIRTLKLEYAIQVWQKASVIADAYYVPLPYWHFIYKSNATSFYEVQFTPLRKNTSLEQQIDTFWKLLEKIADSGDIKVCEGYSFLTGNSLFGSSKKVECCAVLDREIATGDNQEIDDVFTYPYQKKKKSYKWNEIKDLFTQLTLKQLSLVDIEQIHKNSPIDDMLFLSCDKLSVDGVKMAISQGADVNALNKTGESALSHAIDASSFVSMLPGRYHSEEEFAHAKIKKHLLCIEIIDILLAHEADIDLFGVKGMQPLVNAYFCENFELVKYLLEKGSNPNYNSYRSIDVCHRSKDSSRCSVLALVDEHLFESSNIDYEQRVEKLILSYGGRRD